MCHERNCVLGADRGAPSHARQFCATELGSLLQSGGDTIDDACTVASELVTNAVAAGATRTMLRLVVHSTHVRVAVEDDAPGQPHPQRPQADQTHGRGLQIVSALSVGWGVDASPTGKQVWAQIPTALRAS